MPTTDNEEALVDLGFEPASPQLRDEPTSMWERSSEHSHRAESGARLLVRERVVLERKAA